MNYERTKSRTLTIALLTQIVACTSHDSPGTDQVTKRSEPLHAANESEPRPLHTVLEKLIEEPVQGYVLLSNAAFEYSSMERARRNGGVGRGVISLESTRLDHHTPPGGGSYYSFGSLVIFRKVVADHGDVVEVNTTLQDLPESLGHGGKGADYRYELRTYLRKIDLVPVLNRRLAYQYDDGTSITLSSGTAVGLPWCEDETKRAVSVEHLHFELPVPDDYLSLSFTPELRDDLPAEGMPMLADGVSLVLNGVPWATSSEIRDKRLRTPVHHSAAGASRIFVTLVSNGIELKLIAEIDKLVPDYEPQVEGPTLTPIYDTPPRWFYRIPAGTTIYWADGREAGRTRMFTGKQSHVPPDGAMWCEVYTEMMKSEPICFRIADIEVIDNENRD